MASRLLNPSSILLHSSSPVLPRGGLCHFASMSSSLAFPFTLRAPSRRTPRSLEWRWSHSNLLFFASVRFELRNYSAPGLGIMNSIMEEYEAMVSKNKRVRATSKVALSSDQKLLKTNIGKRVLQKGILLEFEKDSERAVLAVVQKPDGKRNWIVCDQNGVVFSIKPQQITYIVHGTEDFEPAEINDFLHKAKHLLDPSLLEYAWEELTEKKQSVNAEELAEIVYGKTDPLECYCAHIMLSQDEIYFRVGLSDGYAFVYEPRSISQVEELLRRKKAKEASQRELEAFIRVVKSAREQPIHAKPAKCFWETDEQIRHRVEALEAFALDACKSDEQKRTCTEVLKALGMPKAASSVVDLLIEIGYFPVHVNIEFLKFDIPTEHSDKALALVDDIFEQPPPDADKSIRTDLTHLKVYAIDVDEADELDDALSAQKLTDGRIKVWIHVADPTRWVDYTSILNKEARSRATSVFLPSETIPMFPVKLAMEKMSLKQGHICNAVSVSVVLNEDGSIAESNIENSTIRPTYMMTYEEALELLVLNIEEEQELRLLSKAAAIRLEQRVEQGAIDTPMIDARIKVPNPDDPEPTINLYIQDQMSPANRLVSEMMILCGEAVALFGAEHGIPLPYRGHSQSNIAFPSSSHLPEGLVRSSSLFRTLRAVEMDYRKPIPHHGLGVCAYVQFTSPIRRYVDILAHYQVKAVLRGESPPFSSGQLEGMAQLANLRTKIVRRLCNNSVRYWILEYLRRQPQEKEFHALILRFVKDKTASLFLVEVGIQGSVEVQSGTRVGDTIMVRVLEAHPRKDRLCFEEVLST